MKSWIRRPSPATVMSAMALFVSLGGVGYAAATIDSGDIKNNSVRGKDIRNGTVRSKDVGNGSLDLVDIKSSQLPLLKGAKGDKGDKGDRGSPGPFSETLPRGRTLRGTYAANGPNDGSNLYDNISFGFTLASAPTPHYIALNGQVPAECSGGAVALPKANPGHLCVFEGFSTNLGTKGTISPSSLLAATADRSGAIVYGTPSAPAARFGGSWAVTGP
jgi:hypothetical protein